jgi:fimbrial chaperone protein
MSATSDHRMQSTLRLFTMVGACCAFIALPPVAGAGEFSVNPIRLELGAAVRSGVITVKNDGKDKLSFQLAAMEWSQDDSGKDQYANTSDLIFFPKIMSVEPGQEGLIRVGTKKPIVPVEKTYRLFIEELPAPTKSPENPGVQINVLIRFGAPIFINPIKAQDALEIEALSLANGALTFSVRNTGNRHQVVQGVQLRGVDTSGKETYALTIADRYLLAGTNKPYTTSISTDQCSKLARVEVEVKTDKAKAMSKLEVKPPMCL